MATHELNKLESQSNNGWQNIGICYIFAEENVPTKLRTVFMALARRSFGYMQRSTLRTTQVELIEAIGISERKFRDDVRELESLGLIKIENPNLYKKGGGSDPCAYSPVFPTGYGKLYFKDTSSGSDKPIDTKPTYDPNGSI